MKIIFSSACISIQLFELEWLSCLNSDEQKRRLRQSSESQLCSLPNNDFAIISKWSLLLDEGEFTVTKHYKIFNNNLASSTTVKISHHKSRYITQHTISLIKDSSIFPTMSTIYDFPYTLYT